VRLLGLEGGSRQRPDRLRNERDDHRLDAEEDAGDLREGAVAHVRPSKARGHRCGRQDERDAGKEEPESAAAHLAEANSQFGRARAGQKVDGSDHVEKSLALEPFAAADKFVLNQGDVRGGPAESNKAHAKERRRTVTDSRPELRHFRVELRHTRRDYASAGPRGGEDRACAVTRVAALKGRPLQNIEQFRLGRLHAYNDGRLRRRVVNQRR